MNGKFASIAGLASRLCGVLPASLIALALATPASAAGEVHVLYETRQDANQFEFNLHSWGSIDDLRNGVNETASGVRLNVGPTYQGVGLDIYQGKPYVLYESRNDLNDLEVGLASWDSVDDLINGVGLVNHSVNLNVPPFYQIAGFDIYQDQVYLLYESRADVNIAEFSLHSWGSIEDFLAGTGETSSSVAQNISSSYQVAGFDIYQGRPYLFYEARPGQPFGSEFGLATWDSVDDFANGVLGSNSSVSATIPLFFRVAGFDILDDLAVNSGVPEPAAWAMMLAGFGVVGAAMRRRRSWKLPSRAAACGKSTA